MPVMGVLGTGEFRGVLGTVYRIETRPSSTNEEFTGGGSISGLTS